MAGEVWLQLAAVNFAATIYDTNDLSIVRGSSFAVLDAGAALLGVLRQRHDGTQAVEVLYSGASELVVRLRPKVDLPPRMDLPSPSGEKKKRWVTEELPALAAAAAGGKDARALAQAVVSALRDRAKLGVDAVVAQIEYMVADRAARAAAVSLTDDQIARAIDAFRTLPNAAFRYFTFAWATHRPTAGETLFAILAALTTRLRAAQLRSLSVALPAPVAVGRKAAEAFCPFTLGRQPVAPGRKVKGTPASLSAHVRKRLGRTEKTGFYHEQVARGVAAAQCLEDPGLASLEDASARLAHESLPLAMDFQELVADPPPGLPPNVEGKLAVVFLDGNGFGARRAQCAKVPNRGEAFEAYRRFCLALERNNARLVADLVDWMLQRDDFRRTTDDGRQLRFETLLWGGDDIACVVPAWGVVPLLDRLRESLAALRLPVGAVTQTPTYKIGVVLAHHKSPIRELRTAADALAVAAKADRSTVQIVALESLDRAELDIARLRREFFGPAAADDQSAFGLALDAWPRVVATMDEIGRTVGRSQLHQWYRQAEHGNLLQKPADDAELSAFMKDFAGRLGALGASPPVVAALCGADPLLAIGAARRPLLPLFHVLTLADYFPPGEAAPAVAGIAA